MLHPLQGVLDLVVPNGVLVLALLSFRVRGNIDALLVPVGTAAAVFLGSWLVAAGHSHASIEVPVGKSLVGGGKLLLTVKGSSEAWDQAANLVS